jgi:ribonuclease D
MNGVRDLTPQQAAVLLELSRYRQDMAQSLDRPLFKVMSDKTLLTIAETCPAKLDQLRRVPGMTERQVHRHGKAILQAVQRGLQAKPLHPPHPQRPTEACVARLEALREWRKLTARKMGVESDIVLPRDLLNALAEKNPRRFEDLATIMNSVPWRLERFGEQILSIIRGGRPPHLSQTT